ncbi:competence protein ComK [Alkalihalophilus lindianensis]|uniref:Competence protein ComK n=1 Tax=Alkalihalophilus lindianensis TaxID=1630542 RepID=A0ABU3X925_9BACI|nr:competence protein ComK [Alkalihalophilus lindianensis]MDV2684396.1 competence protein ComK [Alkalihalophilus lindianensis]
MTIPILLSYEINRNTMALLPAFHTDYDTIVLELDHTYYVKETSLMMMERACIEGGSTYDGRREAVSTLINVHSKVPIPIDPTDHLYTFPTHSPTKMVCIWIFYHHITTFKPLPKSPHKTLITFTNSEQLTIDVSYTTFEKQMQRTSYCIVRLTHRPFERRRKLQVVE